MFLNINSRKTGLRWFVTNC